MKIFHSIPDNDCLRDSLNAAYSLSIDEIYLYRDMIGAVYFLQDKDKKFVFKLYRSFDTNAAIQSTQIISYLQKNKFPVVTIIPTKLGELYTKIQMPEGMRVGVLFLYIAGKEPAINEDVDLIGQLTGRMHNLMAAYPGKLLELGKEHYLGRFLSLMRELCTDQSITAEMTAFGNEFWSKLQSLPKGFAHGDLHTGNLLKTANGEIFVVDFDIASYSYPMFDVATICDDTDFRVVKKPDLEKTLHNFARFLQAYSKERDLTAAERSVILDCIAIHHYELNGTIPYYRLPLQGSHWMNDQYFKLHHTWVKQWRSCSKELLS